MPEPCFCAFCQNAAGNFVGNLFSEIFTLISKPIILVFKCDNNVDYLKNKVAELKDEKDTAENYAEAVERRGEKIVQKLRNWLTSANDRIEAADKLVADAEGNAKKKCFFGLCLNPKSRYQPSKKAEENSKTIDKLVNEARGFNLPLSHIPAPPKEVPEPVKGFEDFYSRKDAPERVMEALQSRSSSIIGVHGMPGMGKTMLAKEIKRKAEQDNLFDVVVMALVSRNAELEKIQVEIARGLGLDRLPNGITIQDAAKRIKGRLKKMKKVLIILDDIWRPGIDLEELGIPPRNEPKSIEVSSSREEYAECKILLTSRDSNVLSDLMGSQQNFPLHQLKDEEAWELLKRIVGDRAENDDIHNAAIEIIGDCGGLPLAITTMAKALKNKQPYEWTDAVRILKRPSSENFDGISAKVYSAIEVSYFHLESEKLKKTFLLCCLLGHEFLIQDLLKYGVGLGLFANTIEEARNEVFTLISKLRASSLLIDDSDNNCFDMHDLIHDVAVSITSRDRHGLLLTGDHVPNDWSDMETRKDFKWICLRHSNVGGLPEELESSRLTLFRLENKNPSLQIPAHFFKGMPRLKMTEELHLRELAGVKNVVDELNTEGFPDLKHLYVCNAAEVQHIIKSAEGVPYNAFPRQLLRLQEISVNECSNMEEIVDDEEQGSSSDIVEATELKFGEVLRCLRLQHLPKLSSLNKSCRQMPLFNEQLAFPNREELQLCWINVNTIWHASIASSYVEKLTKLIIEGCDNLEYLFTSSMARDMIMLGHLEIGECKKMREVLLFMEKVEENRNLIFPQLRLLLIKNLPKLRRFCYGNYIRFPCLSQLLIQSCPVLKTFISSSSFERITATSDKEENTCTPPLFDTKVTFPSLEELTLEWNDNMKEIRQRQYIIGDYFPKIKVLELIQFPEQSDVQPFLFQSPNLRKLVVSKAPFHEIFKCQGLGSVEKPALALTQLSELSKLKNLGPSFIAFKNLTTLEVSAFINLIEYSTAKSMVQLTKMSISKCQMLKEIVACVDEEVKDGIVFIQLKYLLLRGLPRLASFCSGNCGFEFASLEEVIVMGCPNMQIFSQGECSTTNKLKKVKLTVDEDEGF
ncbi:hypothetical protein SLEP1_g54800 [Rubroshorea leprosula]|uniref:AAA+ ATPase domain-containing protein n=1 Tax=Rubroshorea leprosula TaxID=152421 RepID=A0AAV5MGN8_9ROSI|nr:hypothetical protein SLEP1_g54800 [Rubroshorea leprosula]